MPDLSPAPRRRRRRPTSPAEWRAVVAIIAASGVAGAFAGGRPTGLTAWDAVLSGSVAALVAAAGSRAQRWTWLVAAGVAATVGDGASLALAGAALALALLAAVLDRRWRWAGALVGALAVQALLRLGDIAFQGASSLVAAGAVTPMLVSGYRRARRPVQAWVRRVAAVLAVGALAVVALFALAALDARASVNRGVDRARRGLQLVRAGNSEAAADQLAAAAAAFTGANHQARSWLARPARLVPGLAEQARALHVATAAGADLSEVARAAATHADVNRVAPRRGTVDLAEVRRLEAPLRQMLAALDLAEQRLAGARSPWLVAPLGDRIDRVSTEIAATRADAETALAGVRTAPSLLGADGPRRYLVMFATPAETRALGGFMGAFAELVADGGHIRLARTGRAADLYAGTPPADRVLHDARSYPDRYLAWKVPEYLQNLPSSPDLPTVARAAADLYPQAGGAAIDGVVYLDPYALQALLALTGPIELDGLDQPLTSANAASFLLKDQYIRYDQDQLERQDLLEAATRQTFEKLTSGDLPGPRQLADALAPVVRQRRLLAWSLHPGDQPFLRRIGLDGAIPAVGAADFLEVTTANTGANKIDVFLHRDITYTARVSPAGRVTATATVVLSNEAPSSGLPRYLIGNDDGLPSGTNRLSFSLYSPLSLTGATLQGRPLAVQPAVEYGRNRYLAQLAVPAGGSVTVQLRLAGLVRLPYRLRVAPQPVVTTDQLHVDVRTGAGRVERRMPLDRVRTVRG